MLMFSSVENDNTNNDQDSTQGTCEEKWSPPDWIVIWTLTLPLQDFKFLLLSDNLQLYGFWYQTEKTNEYFRLTKPPDAVLICLSHESINLSIWDSWVSVINWIRILEVISTKMLCLYFFFLQLETIFMFSCNKYWYIFVKWSHHLYKG